MPPARTDPSTRPSPPQPPATPSSPPSPAAADHGQLASLLLLPRRTPFCATAACLSLAWPTAAPPTTRPSKSCYTSRCRVRPHACLAVLCSTTYAVCTACTSVPCMTLPAACDSLPCCAVLAVTRSHTEGSCVTAQDLLPRRRAPQHRVASLDTFYLLPFCLQMCPMMCAEPRS